MSGQKNTPDVIAGAVKPQQSTSAASQPELFAVTETIFPFSDFGVNGEEKFKNVQAVVDGKPVNLTLHTTTYNDRPATAQGIIQLANGHTLTAWRGVTNTLTSGDAEAPDAKIMSNSPDTMKTIEALKKAIGGKAKIVSRAAVQQLMDIADNEYRFTHKSVENASSAVVPASSRAANNPAKETSILPR